MTRYVVRTRLGAVLAVALAAVSPAPADPPTAGWWSVAVSTAPHLPQDVWFAGVGNNADGWRGGGSICLNQLAQGFPNGEQLTLLVDVVAGGLFGADGAPVPAGTYTFPGIELPPVGYEVAAGETFYVALDVYVVQSKLPDFEVGDTFRFMFMWDYEPGLSDPAMVLWIDFGFGFVPFLNEGELMANVRFHPNP